MTKNIGGCCCGGSTTPITINPGGCTCTAVPGGLNVSFNSSGMEGSWVYYADDPTYTPDSVFKSAGLTWIAPGQPLPASWGAAAGSPPPTSSGRWYSEPFASRSGPITSTNPNTDQLAAYSLICNLSQWILNYHNTSHTFDTSSGAITSTFIDPAGGGLRGYALGASFPGRPVNACSPFLLACSQDYQLPPSGACQYYWVIS